MAETKKRRSQVNPAMFWRMCHETMGLGKFVREAGRDAFRYGQAEAIHITIDELRGEPVLYFLDTGVGVLEEGRRRLGEGFGWSEPIKGGGQRGAGTGVRQTAASFCRNFTCVTVPKGEPKWAYRLTIPFAAFFEAIAANEWEGRWDRLPRGKTDFPAEFPHGTIFILQDFRATDPDDYNNPEKMQDMSHSVNEENLRQIVADRFRPDLARRFHVNGRQVRPKPYEGMLILREKTREKKGLGEVFSEIYLLTVSGESRVLSLGGLGGDEISLRSFYKDCKEVNPRLAEQIPKVLLDRRLVGAIVMSVCDRYPTPGREHFMGRFFGSEDGHLVVDELERIGAKVSEALREYESRPQSQVTEALLSEIVSMIHERQGTVTGGISEGEGEEGEGEAVQFAEKLRVAPSQAHLEPWDGEGERDSVILAVTNPAEGENFEWDDQNTGLLTEKTGRQVKVTASRTPGEYTITARSKKNPSRECTAVVLVKHKTARPTRDEFLLIPMMTYVEVGAERMISVRKQGQSSGEYEWKVEPETYKGRQIVALDVLPGARKARFLARRHGEFVVSCVDAKNPRLVATCRIEARAVQKPLDGPNPPPGTPPGGDGVTVPGCGTGGAGERPTSTSSKRITFRFEDKAYTFELKRDEMLEDPFLVDPEASFIWIGERIAANFEDLAVRRRVFSDSLSDGIAACLLARGELDPRDHLRFAKFKREFVMTTTPEKPEPNGSGAD